MNLTTKHSKAIAILEKIPGVNTIQVADFKKFFIVLTPKIGTRTIRDALIKHYNLAGSEYIQRKNAQPLIHTMNRDAFQSILRNRTKKVRGTLSWVLFKMDTPRNLLLCCQKLWIFTKTI